MFKKLPQRGLPALALTALPLLTVAPAAHATADQHPASAVAGAPGVRAPLPLFEAIDRIPVADEHREGYKRDLYKHWNRRLNATDGCDTRKEVILSEAVEAPQVAAGRRPAGGFGLKPLRRPRRHRRRPPRCRPLRPAGRDLGVGRAGLLSLTIPADHTTP
ncbi:hypothetical protein [Streptomyces nojiriensis]|uniref:hypothetical protein n=1 Tax=Streptomyces nojiriensis TaxID=66374 RepID=UPI0035D96C15